jgi:hypothetical protein
MRHFVAAILGLFVAAGSVHATLINFDDGTQTSVIGDFYSPLGVTFSGATWQDNLHLHGSDGPNGLASTNAAPYNWTSATPVIATFSSPVAEVALTVIDLGQNGFTVNAYDAQIGGNLVGTITLFGADLGHGNDKRFTVDAASIFRVEMFQVFATSPDGVIVDDFRFGAAEAGGGGEDGGGAGVSVPEPITLALLIPALIGVGVARRWSAKSQSSASNDKEKNRG